MTAAAPGARNVAIEPVWSTFGRNAGATGGSSQRMSNSYLAEPSAARVAVAEAVRPGVLEPGRSSTPAPPRCASIAAPRSSSPMEVRRAARTPSRAEPVGDVRRRPAGVLDGTFGGGDDVDQRFAYDDDVRRLPGELRWNGS